MAASLLTISEFHTQTEDEFVAMDSDVLDAMLAAAGRRCGQLCGNLRSDLHWTLTAHLLEKYRTAGASAAPGPVTARSIAGMSVSYAVVGSSSEADADLASTKWGQLFLTLRRGVMVVPLVSY